MNKRKKSYCFVSFVAAIVAIVITIFSLQGNTTVYAASMDPGSIEDLNVTDDGGNVTSAREDNTNGLTISYNNDSGSLTTPIKMLLVLTIIALAPSILIMLTSYTRIIVVLHFIRTAIGTQTAPPNQVLIGLALFLTLFIMWPTVSEINETAIKPLDAGEITQEEAFARAQEPIREFMYGQVQEKDLKLFVDIADANGIMDAGSIEEYDEIPMTVVIDRKSVV